MVITATNAEYKYKRFRFSDFTAAILDFYKIADTTIKKFDPENIGVAAEISFLSALELEIPLGVFYPPIAMNVCKNTVVIAGLKTQIMWAEAFEYR